MQPPWSMGVIGMLSRAGHGTCLTAYLEMSDVGVYPFLGTNDLYTLPLNLTVTTIELPRAFTFLLWEIMSSKPPLWVQ